jgi:nitroreductase
VLEGDKKDVLISQVCTVHDAIAKNPELASEYPASYAYYPNKWVSPYIDRRRENGWSLYNLLGIKKGEKDKMHLQHQRNFQFFGAPVGLIFTMYKDLGTGAFLDYGMFLQNLMLAAQAYGLSTCPQGAWVSFSKIVMPFIGAGEDEFLVCGMSLGYADQNDVVNTLKTPRESVESFTHWV